jgi:hypothetical protein
MFAGKNIILRPTDAFLIHFFDGFFQNMKKSATLSLNISLKIKSTEKVL